MRVTSKINVSNLKKLNKMMQNNLIKSVDALKADVIDSQVMPFDTGNMQNRSTFIDDKSVKKGYVLLKVDVPYSRRLYFHPEYNFDQTKNPNAQGKWFDPWISGIKKMFVCKTFAILMKKDLKKYDFKAN